MVSVDARTERRTYLRLDYPFQILHAAFQFPGVKNSDLIQGTISNVSAVGVCFYSSFEYKKDTMIRLEIKMGSWDNYKTGYSSFQCIYQGEPFIALAKILRVEKKQINGKNYFETAAKYVSVDEGHMQAVSKFIRKFKENR